MSLIKNLIKDYGDFKIEIPRWELPDAGVTALIGASGAGKTSVFRLLLGLEPCPTLSWQYKDLDLAALSPPERRIGVVFQNLELFPHLSAKENIVFAARARKIKNMDDKVQALIQELELEHCQNRQARLLSGGEAQRVALARALVGEPRFLFLDEPFSALDVSLRQQSRQLVKAVVKQFNVPTLLITHDQEDVKELADHVTMIRNGQLVAPSND